MEQKPLDRLRCVVERITYQSDGYSVLKCAAKGHTDLVAVVGMMPDTHVGSVLTLGGHWKIESDERHRLLMPSKRLSPISHRQYMETVIYWRC